MARLAHVLVLVVALACARPLRPPQEKGPFRTPDLVEVVTLDPTLKTDVRYATTDNFVRRAVYTEARVFLQRPAAEAVVRAHRALEAEGYGLVLFDGYRPWTVTKLFWELTPKSQRKFVADPRKGSRHNRGSAVDATLFDRRTGQHVEMPTGYDDMTDAAYADSTAGTEQQRAHRARLRKALEREGFSVLDEEWWHFDHRDWRLYPVQDRAFSEIPRS